MKFFCEKSLLSEAVSICSRAVSSKSTISVLEGLLITADEKISVCGYDLKTGIRCSFSANIEKNGSVVLNARIFGDIIRKLPDDMVEISVDEKLVTTIKCAFSEFNIIGTSADEYPVIPEVNTEKKISVPQRVLKHMISETVFAVSENENKPIHTGTLFEIDGGYLSLISVDGYRLALRKEKLENECEECSFVVPGDTLKEMERLLQDTDDVIYLYPDKKHILFQLNDTVITARLLEGEFLNYKNAIPKDFTAQYTVSVRNFIDSIERVSLIVNERLKNPVRCYFANNAIRLSCVTTLGKSYDECPFTGKGNDIEIGFNHKYLLDALKACPDDTVIVELKSGLAPCVMRPTDGSDKFVFLVLPVRLRTSE
ncbi:MAG: DNA polymerase III subunit beta [Clostridiales bacterium]|nr:DNA polymerase III subunit beta [Clostridiales bacterium]